jgi:methylglutaconyl-CoA hydratase
MTFAHLDVRRDGALERVTLNRPDVRNAFNEDVIRELTAWARGIGGATAPPRVAVLAGAGKVFSAGADLEWMSRAIRYSRDENLRDAEAMSAMFRALDTLPIPLIGRVHGAALGGGSGLAAVCDVAVAADSAVFGFTEVKLGIMPAVISPFVVAKIGKSAARELFLTGARFSAARAREIGLVHAVVPLEALDATVDAYVREFLTASPSAIAAAKGLIPAVDRATYEDAHVLTTGAIAAQRVSEEGQEGMRAFLEKRTAGWSILKP